MITDPDTLKPDIVTLGRKFLRVRWSDGAGKLKGEKLFEQALDEIESLRARITGLEAMLCDAQAEVERLRASGEAARLRAALEKNVIALENYHGRLYRVHALLAREMEVDIRRGRAALQEDRTDG